MSAVTEAGTAPAAGRSGIASDAAVELEVRRRARGFLTQLHVALKTAQTHDRSNVIFTGALAELFAASRSILQDYYGF